MISRLIVAEIVHTTKRLTSRDSSDQVEDLTTKLAAGVPRVPRLGRLMVEESEQGSRWNSSVCLGSKVSEW